MYKDMNNEFSTFRTLIIEYLKKPNEQRRGRFIQAIQTHENKGFDELFNNYLLALVIWWGLVHVDEKHWQA